MKKAIKDVYLENLAHKIADCINSEDADLYSHLMASSEEYRSQLKTWEYLAFKDRVHYLADNPSEISI